MIDAFEEVIKILKEIKTLYHSNYNLIVTTQRVVNMN